MEKFISGLVVGLICGVLLTVLIPILPNSPNRYEVLRTDNLPIKGVGFTKVMLEEKYPESLYKNMAKALDKSTQAKWEKITSDPVWYQLADEDKMNIWDAFEKTYVPTKEAKNNREKQDGLNF